VLNELLVSFVDIYILFMATFTFIVSFYTFEK